MTGRKRKSHLANVFWWGKEEGIVYQKPVQREASPQPSPLFSPTVRKRLQTGSFITTACAHAFSPFPKGFGKDPNI